MWSCHVGVDKMIELSSFTEVLMSDLSCTKTLVILGWLHTWGTLNRTQTQGLRRTSEPAIGKKLRGETTPFASLIGPSKRDYS